MAEYKNDRIVSVGLIVLSILFCAMFYIALWVESWVGVIFFMASIAFGFILLGFMVAGVYFFVKSRKKNLAFALGVSLASILIVYFDPIHTISEKLKSPVVLSGYCEHTVTQVSLVLRKDMSFEYNPGAFLKKEMYYGRYLITGDTIILDFDSEPLKEIKNKLVIHDSYFIEIGDSLEHLHGFIITTNYVDSK
ncbi:MAG: hypothetical protein ACI8RP_001810 [Urechidicola sp.]|jgi:hypothetical protein